MYLYPSISTRLFVCIPIIIYEDICEYTYMYSYINIKYKYYYNCKYFYFLLNKGLIRVYTRRNIKQISDIQHGMIVINGIIISILVSLLSLFVQLYNVILS